MFFVVLVLHAYITLELLVCLKNLEMVQVFGVKDKIGLINKLNPCCQAQPSLSSSSAGWLR